MWVQQLQGLGWAIYLSLDLGLHFSPFRPLSPLISGPSAHCPSSSDDETEAREGKSSRKLGGQLLAPGPSLGSTSAFLVWEAG